MPNTMTDVKISLSLWQRVLLFQSTNQLNSYLIGTSVIACIAATFLYFVETKPKGILGLSLLVFVPTMLVPLTVVAGTLPAKFRIIVVNGAGNIISIVDEEIMRLGYKRIAGADYSYEPTTATWQNWNENRLSIISSDSELEICGPVFILRILRKRLGKKPVVSDG